MRILHVCNHFYPCVGGIERYVEGLCKNLIKLGHQSDIVCLNTCAYSKERLQEYEEYNGIRIHRVPYINLKFYKIAPNVLKLIGGYDLIHIHGLGFFSDLLSLTKFIHKKPLILSTHGGIFHTRDLYRLKKIYFESWCRLTLKKFDKIIAVGKNDARLFSKISSNVVFIPNAIEVEDFADLKRKTEGNSFLYVGRISKNKRIDNLITTTYFLKEKIPDIKLYIVGEDWECIKKDLEKLVEEKGLDKNVIFTGGIEDKEELHNYYSKAKFFVSASEYEGFGISVLEAMAAGLVTIVNDIDVFRDLIEDGEDGFLIDYSNPKRAANRVLDLIEKDLTKIDKNARDTASRYDWKSTVRDIEKVYGEAR